MLGARPFSVRSLIWKVLYGRCRGLASVRFRPLNAERESLKREIGQLHFELS